MTEDGNGLPELPLGWVLTTLDESAQIILGQSPPSSTYNEDGVGLPFYQGKAEFGDTYPTPRKWCSQPKKIAEKGDVLISVRAPVGPTNICPEKSCIGRGLAAIRGLDGIQPRFILYLMRLYENVLAGRGTGTTFNAITGSQLRGFEIPLPPLPEQQRIVAKIEELFTQLDAGVAALEKARAQLRRYRQAVLKAAVEGELTREWREAHRGELEPASVLLGRILEERRGRWEAEQLEKMRAKGKAPRDDKWKQKYKEPVPPDALKLPELPEGWAWARWEQIGFSQNGRAFPSKEYQPSGFRLLRPGNLHASGKVVWTEKNTRYMPERWAKEFPRHIVGPGELVMNLTAQSLKDDFLGRACMTGPTDYCLLNQRIARLTPVEVSSVYLLWLFKSKVFRRFVDGLNTGSLIQHMFTSQLVDFPLPLPPLVEQERISIEVERCISVADEMEKAVEQSLKRAKRLRQSILKRAFEGKLAPQDPSDEPASTLLERIKAEKARREVERRARGRSGKQRSNSSWRCSSDGGK